MAAPCEIIQVPWDLPSHWKPYMSSLVTSTSCVLCVKLHTTAESVKWSDTFPGSHRCTLTRPGLGSTPFKICIHLSISIDLYQKQLQNYLWYRFEVLIVKTCWNHRKSSSAPWVNMHHGRVTCIHANNQRWYSTALQLVYSAVQYKCKNVQIWWWKLLESHSITQFAYRVSYCSCL